MKHGKRHRAEVARSLPEWERKFLAYKKLKRKLKLMNPNPNGRHRARSGPGNPPTLDTGFNRSLNQELDKVNTFYLDKEEDYIIMFRELESRAENLDSNEEMSELQREILDFHSEMVMLLHYSVINFAGLMKIVKKHNKRAGGAVYSSCMLRVLQQPFFSTELLYNLIRGSEAILERFSPPNDP
ncbi:SPX domain gene 1, ARABIDOPSIS THALIANA SPX DOMAIN GENE 1 [Hibiscus trionum]|uniref:SPX domain gene 1, ARABIDOPSIS THALIANA SPX DOMAIN GENE 1 n=1 Tax=Hibiscus trionum TaxID=183268 RepID=A0A9W7ID83_HIBTR|nr:SPX domain gene 1, ARABIDOPSIS THALIANA SPX DOMAIN GENE 1 [Hibiscus trionum]